MIELCKLGGFNLGKVVSNCNVLGGRPENVTEERRALGVNWNYDDTLSVRFKFVELIPSTRRELLSQVAGIYDPLGIVAPLCLEGRLIIQESFSNMEGWDEQFSENIKYKLSKWQKNLKGLENVSIQRNLYVQTFSRLELHVFSDASERGHGAVAYIRLCHKDYNSKCLFVWGKAKVNPLKTISIPRLELIAATLASKMRKRLESILTKQIDAFYMWTDSMTVLRYLRNKKDRFEVFVANRVSIIRARTKVEEWRYVNSLSNPADDASRHEQSSRWLNGPLFLQTEDWPLEPAEQANTEESHKKVMQVAVLKAEGMDTILSFYSSWNKLGRALAWFKRFKLWLLYRKSGSCLPTGRLSMEEIEGAKNDAIRYSQKVHFEEEIEHLKQQKTLKSNSSLRKLNCFIGGDGTIRVKGRLGRLGLDAPSPAILSRKSVLVTPIVREVHSKLGHLGCATVLGELRERYWITQGHVAVKSVISKCTICRKVQGKPIQQKMADLPEDRIEGGSPPFTNTGMDVFGPFIVKRGRQTQKKYGVIFCCMASRAIHLELMDDMTSDSTVNAIRRFQARRGRVKMIRCDNGTNFLGAMKEMRNAWQEVDVGKRVVDAGIEWRFNPPKASNFGGVWERLIRTVRRVFESIVGGTSLHEDTLRTVFCEVEAIVNSRPLSLVTSDARDMEVITPNKLLNLGESVGQCGRVH